MKSLLVDVNIEGYLATIERLLNEWSLDELFQETEVGFHRFTDFDLSHASNDRSIWNFCQVERIVLLTNNHNQDDINSLETSLRDSLQKDSLPVLTLGDINRFRNNRAYQQSVTNSIAEILFSIKEENQYLGVGRMFIPLQQHL